MFTVAQSSKLERELPGGHTKNLFLKDKNGRLFLVVALGETRVDLKALNRTLGGDKLELRQAGAAVWRCWACTPGSVTPFALINDKAGRVTVVLDADMMRHERLNFHPLENTATTNIGRDDLVRFIRACGHEPLVLTLAAAASPVHD